MTALAQLPLVLAQVDDGGFSVTYVAVGVVVGAIVGAGIGAMKNRVGLGAVLGGLLGCIGWLIVAIIPRKARY